MPPPHDPHAVPLGLAAKVALVTGSVYVSSLILLHLFVYVCDVTPATRWAGLAVIPWLQTGQITLVICVAALSTYHLARHVMAPIGHPTDHTAPTVQESSLTELIEGPALMLGDTIADTGSGLSAANAHLSTMVREFALLYEIGQGINATIELDELFDVITAMVRKHLQLNEFAILLMDEHRETLRVRAAYGFPNMDRIHDMVFQMGEGVCGEVARSGRHVYVRDTRRDRRYLHYRGEYRAEGSFLSIPLRYKKEVLGVINFSRRGVASFTKGDVRLLTLIANQIALAIANARLYTRTRELSVRDDLTGLYNRRHFQHVLQIEWKRAVRFRRSLSVLMIDVDRFKAFNDTFGHLQGDKVLKQLSALLHRRLREVDTVARFGGEEFVVLLPDTDRQGALAVGEKLRQLVEQERFPLPAVTAGASGTLTISVGIAAYPEDVREMEDLIDHADIALYDAKDAGRNRVVGYPQVVATEPSAVTPRPLRSQLDS